MNWYEKIKEWYTAGAWNDAMVHNAVVFGKITKNEEEEILNYGRYVY